MKKKLLITSMLMATTLLSAQMSKQEMDEIKSSNPLVMQWNTPHQTPPFDLIKTEHYKPAMLYAIEKAKDDVNKIISNTAEPTFENTIVAYEQSGKILDKVSSILFNMNEACTSEEMQQVAQELTPILTKYSNDVSMNPQLFAKIKMVYDNRDFIKLTTEDRMLLDKVYKGFIKNGALLTGDAKEEFRKASEELSVLSLKFNQNVLNDQNAFVLNVTNKKDVEGMPAYALEAAQQEAKARGMKGYAFTLDQPSYVAVMSYCPNREIREKIWRAYNSMGNHGDTNDNKQVIKDIVNLRLKIANLLGYQSYAEYELEDKMAETPAKVNDFLNDLLNTSMPYAKRDLKAVQEYASNHGFEGMLNRWDFSYWSEKLQKEKYDISPELLKPYFNLEYVKKGIFELAGKLYNLEFRENKSIPVYHKDVQVYEVWDKTSNKFMAVLYMDFFPRDNKRQGAWMTSFREESKVNNNEIRPLIQLVTNFSKPTSKTPSLLTFDEVTTFLHEFGHCLHGIVTECTYQSLSGTSVAHDFVEGMSQFMENYAYEKEFLDMFAVNYKTGDKIPQKYIDRIREAQQYNAGWLSIRQLFFGILDMTWHSIEKPFNGNVLVVEQSASRKAELMPMIDGCMMSTQFSHIFGGGYAAGYYGYKWSEVIAADAYQAFTEQGIFNPAVSSSFRKNVLSRGGSKKPMELYKAFRGHEPTNEAFLKQQGFVK
ncbi:MAG: M3 family metallopeptidase [Bacteroidales bacterium]|nr:M3 family metallopeptidase [Bacteroidales bacterium]